MSLLRVLLALLIIGSVALLVLFVSFTWETFSLKPKTAPTDAVVVLAGGKGRIEEGVRLYRESKVRELFLIGVDPAVRKRDLVRELPGDQIVLENASRNTLENALYARDLLVRKDVRSFQLITSRYHILRALVIFRNVLPRDIVIYPYPVDSKNLKEEWWRHAGSFRLLFTEFYKYYLYRFFFIFASEDLRAGPIPAG